MSTDTSTATGDVPRGALVGAASGISLMAVFGTAWAFIGIGGLQGDGPLAWLSARALALGVALRGLPHPAQPARG